jgi:hypothetical protein
MIGALPTIDHRGRADTDLDTLATALDVKIDDALRAAAVLTAAGGVLEGGVGAARRGTCGGNLPRRNLLS